MNSKTSRVSRGKLLESLRTDNEKDKRKKIFQKKKSKNKAKVLSLVHKTNVKQSNTYVIRRKNVSLIRYRYTPSVFLKTTPMGKNKKYTIRKGCQIFSSNFSS